MNALEKARSALRYEESNIVFFRRQLEHADNGQRGYYYSEMTKAQRRCDNLAKEIVKLEKRQALLNNLARI